MKLYATIESERGGRPARKGGDEVLKISVKVGNSDEYLLCVDNDGILLQWEGVDIVDLPHRKATT